MITWCQERGEGTEPLYLTHLQPQQSNLDAHFPSRAALLSPDHKPVWRGGFLPSFHPLYSSVCHHGAPFPAAALSSALLLMQDQLREQSPTCGREGGNCCFAFAPFAKFNIPGLILIKPDPMACLGFFLKSKASQSSLGTKALSESECHHRGFCGCFQGLFGTCFCCYLKPQGLWVIDEGRFPLLHAHIMKQGDWFVKRSAAHISASLDPPESCLKTAVVRCLLKGLQQSSIYPVTWEALKRGEQLIWIPLSFSIFSKSRKERITYESFPFLTVFHSVWAEKASGPGLTEEVSRQQFYKRGAKIKSCALIRSRNQFLLLVGFFFIHQFCSFTRVINMLSFEEKNRFLQN